jgi:F0F1-type ATP synthase membrane subunit b/b'
MGTETVVARRAALALALACCWGATAAQASSTAAQKQRQPGAELNRQEQASPAEPEPQDTRAGVVFRWLNLAVIVGVLGYALAKYASPVFRARAEAVSAEITKATRRREEAEERLRRAEAGLAQLDQEIAVLRSEAENDFEAEAQRLRLAGKQELEKIEHVAALEIDAAARTAQLDLRAFAARLTVERAEALLRQRMTAQSRVRLFRRFLGALPAFAGRP